MKKFSTLVLTALVAFGGAQAWAQSNAIPGTGVTAQVNDLSSVALSGTGVITVIPRIGPHALPANNVPVDNTPAGMVYVAGNLTMSGVEISPTDSIPSPGQTVTGPGSAGLYTLTKTAATVAGAGASDAFVGYGTVTNTPTPYWTYPAATAALTPGSYAGLTYASNNLSVGSNLPLCFYTIHHSTSSGSVPTDYFAQLSTPTEGFVDVKTMSGGTVPATPGLTGYFALAYATSSAAAPGNNMWYLRTAGASDHLLTGGVGIGASAPAGDVLVGWLAPAVGSGSNDLIDLNAASTKGSFGGTAAAISGYTTLAFLNATPSVGNYTGNVFYYLRQDVSVGAGGTGNTILGKLDPTTGARTISDIANLGAVYSSLAFSPDALGIGTGGGAIWGSNQFYVTGPTPVTAQSVSFAAIADQVTGTPFTVSPSASGGGALTLTVVAGSTGTASISAPVAGVFTVTPYSPGLITLKANQAGSGSFTANMLQQSFNSIGAAVLQITSQPASLSGVTAGTTANFSVTAIGTATLTYQWRKAGVNIPALSNASAITASLSLPTVSAADAASYDVVVTNGSALTLASNVVTLALVGAPAVTSATAAPATVGTPFSYTITANNGPITGYGATGLGVSGLTLNSVTGVISGTPLAAGPIAVNLTATNGSGSGAATLLTITVAAAGVVPSITSATTAPATVGTAFSYSIVASNGPITSYAATGLPGTLTLNTVTGVISGTPSASGPIAVSLTATNGTGTSAATLLTITVAAAGVVPTITSAISAPATVGSSFNYSIIATNSPLSYAASGLPTGLAFNTSSGLISGTPSAQGVYNVTLTATNGIGTSFPAATLTITVAAAGGAPSITSGTIATGTVGTAFNYGILATGSPTAYSASGLPAGLAFNATTGAINGTPTTVGTSAVTIGATNGVGTGTMTVIIVIAPASAVPIITSPITAPGTVGAPFPPYVITATGVPTSYTATGLPPGLALNPLTGAITGTPTVAGTYVVIITATNSLGTSTSTVTITVAGPGVAPIVTNNPLIAAGTIGIPFSFTITATGVPTSYSTFNLPPGLTINPLTGVISGTPTAAGTTFVTLNATNTTSTGTATLMIVVAPATAAPIITGPTSTTGAVGSPFVTFLIVATGLPTSYTASGLPPGLTLNALTGAINGTPTTAGNYLVTLTATNSLGTSTATLLITVGPNLSSRLTNFSARAISGPGDQSLIMGFVVAGNGKNLLVRGIGPTLANFGIVNFLADPLLTLSNSSGVIATNDDWSIDSNGVNQSVAIAAAAARVGAFALPAGSKDSALLVTLNNGAHTSGLLRPNSTTGVALTEIYDTDTVIGARLINVSARMNVTTGEGTLIAGFVIGGTVPKTVLIRGVGPTLSVFGVGGVLADPQIAVYSGTTLVGSNDNWEVGTTTAAQLAAASAQVGAFALPTGSKDASMLITLQPGAYTVLVTGVGGTTGIALIEIYDTQ